MSEQIRIVAVIPARMASRRFPRKILFDLHGLPMVEHVRRRALLVEGLADLYVATCDDEIADVIKGFGGKVLMTSKDHHNGTTRVAEAIEEIDCSHVVLLQGDEPLLLPNHVNSLIMAVQSEPHVDSWNATGSIYSQKELDRNSYVKCSVASDGKILYCFRRSPSHAKLEVQQKYIQKMFGLIAYRKDFVIHISSLSQSLIEATESIEQMRILENGYTLKSVHVEPSLPSVNEPYEADLVLDYIEANPDQQALLETIMKG